VRGRIEERLARRGGAVELLRAPALVYAAAVGLRGALYDRGWLARARLEVPVVCVGNLSAGGSGKTPMVAWVVRALERRGLRPGILARGYGSRGARARVATSAGGGSDEALVLAELCPGVRQVEDVDRARGGFELERAGVDVVVMDDGFQHRRLARDLDLVLIDATRPWGLPSSGGRPLCALLPRGLLRESPAALRRAHAIVVTRSDQVEPAELVALEAELGPLAPGAPIARAVHAPVRLRELAGGAARPLDGLAGREVDLASGLGNPEAFERTVRGLGVRVREHRRFPDHHQFAAGDLDGLGGPERPLVVSAKDAVKLARLGRGAASGALVLDVELELTSGEAPLLALFDALPAGRARRERSALHEGLHG
jgi:tetraacyldisaccharide 4'-kinase